MDLIARDESGLLGLLEIVAVRTSVFLRRGVDKKRTLQSEVRKTNTEMAKRRACEAYRSKRCSPPPVGLSAILSFFSDFAIHWYASLIEKAYPRKYRRTAA
jgi:hypothetical protein